MVKEAILDYCIYNNNKYSTEKISTSDIASKASIYEVIRMIDGVPLYLQEHLNRLRKSAELLGMNIDKTDKELTEEIMKLAEVNHEYNLNVKILCFGEEKSIEDIYLYFIKSSYPSEETYKKGVHTIIYESERENPNAKTFNKQLRQRINKCLEERQAFEALLVNDNRQITEGSRSNVFFVKNEKLFTPPANKVLLGVTRTKIIELCRQNNIEIIEQEIDVNILQEYEGAFITGTSINALPIKSIDGIDFESPKNSTIIKVMTIYEKNKNDYISQRKE